MPDGFVYEANVLHLATRDGDKSDVSEYDVEYLEKLAPPSRKE